MLGLTQQQLADLIGVTYQQAHKYERGINRVSAGRLFEIARVLSVAVLLFGASGEQPDHALAGTRVFVLPNTSGLNAHFKPADFARIYREFRDFVERTCPR